MQRFDLATQIIRHGWPMGLVLLEQGFAKSTPRCVENHPDAAACIVLQQFSEHVGDPQHGMGRLPLRVGQRRQGMKGPVQEGRTIDQDKGMGRDYIFWHGVRGCEGDPIRLSHKVLIVG